MKLHTDGQQVAAVDAVDVETGQVHSYPADYVFSTMPVQELVAALEANVPSNIREVADGLMYRDMVTVGLLLKKLKVRETGRASNARSAITGFTFRSPTSRWAACRCTTIGARIWWPIRPQLGSGSNTSATTETIWRLSDADMLALAKTGIGRIGIIDAGDVFDGMVCACPRRIPPISAPMIGSANSSSISTGSRICSSWAATACTSTTTRTIRC